MHPLIPRLIFVGLCIAGFPGSGHAQLANNQAGNFQAVDFEGILKGELDFVDRICKLSQSQRDLLEDAGEKYFLTINDRLDKNHVRVRIQDRIAFVVSTELPSEMADRYMKEHGLLREFEKHSAAENVVVTIDKMLALTAQQREQIVNSLSTIWNNYEVPTLEKFSESEFDITIPEECVLPFLQESQKVVWNDKTQRHGRAVIHVKNDSPAGVVNLGPNPW